MTKHAQKTPEVVTPDRAPTPWTRPFGQLGVDEWFDRWPDLLSRRWAESLRTFPGFDEGVRVEQCTEDDGTFVVRAEVPGVDPDEGIEITVLDGQLTITAEREDRSEQRDGSTYRSEFRYGSFSRTIGLPEGADEDGIIANVDSGILEIRVPCTGERPAAKTIPVTSQR